jgi:MFS family permease
VLIVRGGRLADLVGRWRIFFAGAAIFAAFSVLGGRSPDAWMLIACRALMGIGGALMWPATLSMTYAILPKERAALAGGLIIGAAGFGNAAGPLIGGVLTEALSWRWILTARAGDGISSSVERVVRTAFESGFQTTFLLVAVLAFAGFVVTVLLVGRAPRGRHRDARPLRSYAAMKSCTEIRRTASAITSSGTSSTRRNRTQLLPMSSFLPVDSHRSRNDDPASSSA